MAKEAKIYITGQIGTSYNDDGSILVKGVELQDIIAQVESQKGASKFTFIINSQGGSVQVGKAISKYISYLQNAFTVASKFCASVATEIHLSVPLANREIVAGTEYFLHAPMISNIKNANADELAELSDFAATAEKEMVSMYVKATGVDKVAIEGLMKQESALTAEQCIQMKFASKIIPAEEIVAMKKENIIAFVDKKINSTTQNQNNMTKLMKAFEDMIALAQTKLGLKAEEVVAKMADVKLEDGTSIKIEQAGATLAVGDKVTDDKGQPTPDKSYTLANGDVIKTDKDSVISEITPKEKAPEAPAPTAEATAMKAENETLKAEVTKLKAESETNKSEIALVSKKIEMFGKLIASSEVVKDTDTRFRTRATSTEANLVSLVEQRKKIVEAEQAKFNKK